MDTKMPTFNPDESSRLFTLADHYFAQASTVRDLAAAIDQRRIALLNRLDPCVRRHVPEVWSSTAADISRMKLNRMIARDVWNAADQLLATRVALVRHAEEAEAHAFDLQHRARELSAVDNAAQLNKNNQDT